MIRLRGTFIHIDDARDAGTSGGGSRTRARTESPHRPGAELGVHDSQREDYVAGLGERLKTMWGATKMRDHFVFDGMSAPAAIAEDLILDGMSAPAALAKNSVPDGMSAPAALAKSFVLDDMSVPAALADNLVFHGIPAPAVAAEAPKQLEQQAANHMASALLLQAKLASMSGERSAAVIAMPPSGDSDTRAPSSYLSLRDVGSTVRPLAEVATPETVNVNEGSVGHPFTCSRPCLHFAAGKCTHGLGCEFCHMEHLRRPVHLDKKNRELLQTMSKASVVMLVLPLLKQKMLAFDTSVESRAAFNKFARGCGVDISAISDASVPHVPRSQRTLVSMCHAMSFRTLLQTLRRSSLQGDAAEAQALELLAHLRGRARHVAAIASAPAPNA